MNWKLQILSPCINVMISSFFNNYRLVSVLPSVSNVFEGIMYNRLTVYLNEYKSLFSYQFGSRNQHSNHMALMTLIDKLTKCHDIDEYVIGVFEKGFWHRGPYYLTSKMMPMASEEMLCHGSRAIWKLRVMVYYLKLKYYNVEFHKVPFLDHCSI